MGQAVKIISIKKLTHDVLQFTTEKPLNIQFLPGQAVDVSINKTGWQKEFRAFTITSLPDEDHLEFVIKTYSNHSGVTNELTALSVGDQLIIGGVFGDITYQGEGLFIAGGTGITPFLAIFKQLERENKLNHNILLFANKTKADIILENELSLWLGDNVVHVLSKDQQDGYKQGYITKDLIDKVFSDNLKYVYLCGPAPMMVAVEGFCLELGLSSDKIIKEEF